jgi:hypothetical protein
VSCIHLLQANRRCWAARVLGDEGMSAHTWVQEGRTRDGLSGCGEPLVGDRLQADGLASFGIRQIQRSSEGTLGSPGHYDVLVHSWDILDEIRY